MTADTIVPDPTDPQSMNRYTYTLGNPLVYIDPSGHCNVALSLEGGGDAVACAAAGVALVAGIAWGFSNAPRAIEQIVDDIDFLLPDIRDLIQDRTKEEPKPVPLYPDLPDPSNDPNGVIYQFSEPSGSFKNNPGPRDHDGISIAFGSLCNNDPVVCYHMMFPNAKTTPDTTSYRQTTVGALQSQGFVVDYNGGQVVPNSDGELYPLPHGSVRCEFEGCHVPRGGDAADSWLSGNTGPRARFNSVWIHKGPLLTLP